jgi:cyclic-di-GMP-binding protein
MPAESSFDVVSEFDQQELANAVDQALREIQTRYDLKDSKTTLELSKEELLIGTDSELSLTSIRDILETKAIRRKLSLKIFSYGEPENSGGMRVRQVVKLQQGIDSDLAKKIVKLIRDQFPKIQPRIQGDTLRVASKSKDDLQNVMRFLREKEPELPVALQFNNYR